ncbi:MAG: Eco57I restriction-modification methylase domain-containing protein, partial [Bdellovibrionales bacterium]|nr:Eco57I restriction-modification methylase domain-containing protein [Bdellovibrionales bacterium]
MSMLKINYNPDVLSCLANLSNDEVFTPPHIANQMLDLLPAELWSDKNATFLDPMCKSGVFLREIAKRLIKGLEEEIPDIQARINHVFTRQLYGIAITELTSLLSRRSVYCSKLANSKYSVCDDFKTTTGNIKHGRIEHKWDGERCVFCGATRAVYDRGEELESYAYEFIHTTNPKEIFNMKFDVIVGNPPYQLNVGVEQENYSVPLYHLFIQQAKKLNPRFLTMIVPARWYAGGRGLDEFRKEMLEDSRIRKIVDYPNATDCFPGVDISGGVCYFLWERDSRGACEVATIKGNAVESRMERPLLEDDCDTFIRFNPAISILRKIKKFEEKTFDTMVSPQTPFGIISSFKKYKEKPFDGSIKLHTVDGVKYIEKEHVTKNQEWVNQEKLYISKSYGERGSYPYLFLAKPFIGDAGSCCTQTYLMIGPFEDRVKSENAISYIHTKFFRFLIMLKKNT